MALLPLGNRILVQPDAQPEKTDSGIVLPGDRDHVPTSGVIVAVGDGPARDARIRAAVIARCMAIVLEMADQARVADPEAHDLVTDMTDELRRYKNQAEQFDSLKVGDRVVYPAEVGLVVQQDGTDYIILNEDDAVAVDTDNEEAA